MKKVLWIQIVSYKPNSDAPANRAVAFANFFKERGWKVNIITNGNKNTIEKDEGVIIYRLKNKFYYKKKNIINRLLSNLVFLHKTKTIIKKNKMIIKNSFFMASSPELITSKAGLLAKKNGAVFVFDVRDIWPEVAIEMNAFSEKSIFAKIFRKCANKLYDKAEYITTVTKRKTKYLRKYLNGRYASKVHHIANGFDLNDLKLEPDYSVIEKYSLTNQQIVSYVGNVGAAQGLDIMLSLAESYKKIFFLICGKGKEFEKLQLNVKEKQLNNVIFTGSITKNAAIAVTKYSYISYISLQSEKMRDSVPTKLYESLGFGTPVFLIAEGEAVEILNESRLGVSANPIDFNGIKKQFKEMIENHENIIANKDYAINFIKKEHSRQNAAENLLNIFEMHLN